MNELKNRTQICTTLENSLRKDLHRLSSQTKIPMTRLLDEAVDDLLEKYNNLYPKKDSSRL